MRYKILLSAAIIFIMAACSKTSDVVPADQKGSGNQIEAPVKDTHSSAIERTGVTFRKVTNPRLITDYVLQLPASYNTETTKKWPVIIFLHGVGDRGNTTEDLHKVRRAGLAAIAAKNPNFPFIVVSPQCKTDSWWDVPSLNVLYDDIVRKYRIDPKRIYVTGLSMGGYGAWNWVAYYPSRFAAAVPIAGAGPVAKACALKDKPVWAFHNADDPTVNVSGSRNMVNAIKACGGRLIRYTENPTGGHDAWTKAYNDPALFTWLSGQRLP